MISTLTHYCSHTHVVSANQSNCWLQAKRRTGPSEGMERYYGIVLYSLIGTGFCNGTQSLPVVPGTAADKKGTCMQPIRQILKWVPPDLWLVQLASKLQCNKITAQNVCNLHYPSRCTWEGHDVGKEISKLVCVAVQSLINQRSHKVHRKTQTTNMRCIC